MEKRQDIHAGSSQKAEYQSQHLQKEMHGYGGGKNVDLTLSYAKKTLAELNVLC